MVFSGKTFFLKRGETQFITKIDGFLRKKVFKKKGETQFITKIDGFLILLLALSGRYN